MTRARRFAEDDLLDGMRKHRTVALRIARGWMRKLPKNVQLCDIEQAALIGLFEWKSSHPDDTRPGWIGGLKIRIRGSIIDELRRQDWLPRGWHTENRDGEPSVCVVGCADADPFWELNWANGDEGADVILERKQAHAEALRAPISRRDAELIERYYFRGQLFKDIAARFGVSEPRVTGLHDRAISVMRAHMDGDEQMLRAARQRLERAAWRERKEHDENKNDTGEPVMSTLPENGVDLRAELARYQDWMIDQALIRTLGNKAKAARLLGLKRTTLVEMLNARGRILPAPAQPTEPEPDDDEPKTSPHATRMPTLPRIVGGVERISAAVIRRYAIEGLDEKQIARRLGCNPFLVEKVLREQTAAEIVRLDREEKLTPKAIAVRLRIPLPRVRGVLSAADRQRELAHRASASHNERIGGDLTCQG